MRGKSQRFLVGILVVVVLLIIGTTAVAQDMKHTPYLDSDLVTTGLLLCDADGCQGPDDPVQLSFWDAFQQPGADHGDLIVAYMANTRARIQQHLGL